MRGSKNESREMKDFTNNFAVVQQALLVSLYMRKIRNTQRIFV